MRTKLQTIAPGGVNARSVETTPAQLKPGPIGSGEPTGLLTTAQLLKLLPISRRTLSDHVAAGLIPSIKLGKRRLWHWPSIQEALLRRQREAA